LGYPVWGHENFFETRNLRQSISRARKLPSTKNQPKKIFLENRTGRAPPPSFKQLKTAKQLLLVLCVFEIFNISGGGKSLGEKRPKVRDNRQKLWDTTTAFFGVFDTKNAKSDRGSVPELLDVFPRTIAPHEIVFAYFR
jgi:hypothetical protein